MRHFGILGLVGALMATPAVAAVTPVRCHVAEAIQPSRRRVAVSAMAHRRYRSRNERHRRSLRANRLTVSRRVRRRHRRQRRAA